MDNQIPEKLELSQKDKEMIESRKIDIEQIFRAFMIPDIFFFQILNPQKAMNLPSRDEMLDIIRKAK